MNAVWNGTLSRQTEDNRWVAIAGTYRLARSDEGDFTEYMIEGEFLESDSDVWKFFTKALQARKYLPLRFTAHDRTTYSGKFLVAHCNLADTSDVKLESSGPVDVWK